MSDQIKHECGIALLRLRKPLAYYIDKYNTPSYAVNKMYLMLEKQRNRGQDGVGLACIKLDQAVGKAFVNRLRSASSSAIEDIFQEIGAKFDLTKKENPKKYLQAEWLKKNVNFAGEVFLGHLRYGTHGKSGIKYCHPMLRRNSWRSRNLVVAGNFNMTNVDELFKELTMLGQHPKEKIDTVTVMEKIGHFLDTQVQKQFDQYKAEGYTDNREISALIEQNIDLEAVLKRACKDFDGGYAMAGITGSGTAFVARDPAGIRPAYYYVDQEVIVVASESSVIQTVFGAKDADVKQIKPAHALIIDKAGKYKEVQYIDALPQRSCSFERIYFSKGTDPQIYGERKHLGRLLVPQILQAIDHQVDQTIFSYIPNTAESAFLGMMQGLEDHLIEQRISLIAGKQLSAEELLTLLKRRPRVEKMVIKDKKLRTFITDDASRSGLVSHVYDTTFGQVRPNEDHLVVIDDSIVRGTTLEKSILTLLDRVNPKSITIVSSAPQIRYPDCYGIDMSRLQDFIAFRAMIELLEQTAQMHVLNENYLLAQESLKQAQCTTNYLQKLYNLFTDDQISAKIAEIVSRKSIKSPVKIVYQTVENLHKACPDHLGDWYFTGNYPTPGGTRVVNRAFVNFVDGKTDRAY